MNKKVIGVLITLFFIGVVTLVFLFLNQEGKITISQEKGFIPLEVLKLDLEKEFNIPEMTEELSYIRKYFSENTEVLTYISEKEIGDLIEEHSRRLNEDGWNKIMSVMGSEIFEKEDVVISISVLPITDEDRKNHEIEKENSIIIVIGDLGKIWRKTMLSEPPIYIRSEKIDLSSEDMREALEKLKEIVSPNAEILLLLTEDDHRNVDFWYYSILSELGWEITKESYRFNLWEKNNKGIYINITGYMIIEGDYYTSIFIIKDNIEVWKKESIFEKLDQF